MPDPFEYGAGLSGPAGDLVPITPGAGDLVDPLDDNIPYIARGLLCATGGLATIVMPNGKTRTGIPLFAGWNPCSAKKVTAFAGTNLWGVKG